MTDFWPVAAAAAETVLTGRIGFARTARRLQGFGDRQPVLCVYAATAPLALQQGIADPVSGMCPSSLLGGLTKFFYRKRSD